MGMRSVIVRVDHQTYDVVDWGVPKDREDPKDGTVSGWLRLMVETLVTRPETNLRRRALLRLEVTYPAHLLPPAHTTLGYTLAFRVEAEHWAARTALAREPREIPGQAYEPPRMRPGMSREEYFRRIVYIGSVQKRDWYGCYKKDQDVRYEPRIQVYS